MFLSAQSPIFAIPPSTASDVRFRKPPETLLSRRNGNQGPLFESDNGMIDIGVGVGSGIGIGVGIGLANPIVGICPLHIGIGVDVPG
jgi:hypothetical protein